MIGHPAYRDPSLVNRVAKQIHGAALDRHVKFCHVCGTHEWTITHYGLRTHLPSSLDVIAGPGCPVCVIPAAKIDEAVELALKGVTLTVFGDIIRVPGSEMSLLDARARGCDVRVVYSVKDAVEMAQRDKKRQFTFFSIGFETTAPSTAVEVLNGPPSNLTFLIGNRLIPPAMELLLGIGDLHIDGFIAPGHVSTIIGLTPYEVFPQAYHMPTVVAGFEPLDVLFALSILLKQVQEKTARLENEYTRAVRREGNIKAQKTVQAVFDVVGAEWRGLGRLPESALTLKEQYAEYDACEKHGVHINHRRDLPPGCKCHLVMIGKIRPDECQLFLESCSPQHPKGPCMVSTEGTCRIWASHTNL